MLWSVKVRECKTRTSEVLTWLMLGSDRARKGLGSVRMSDRLC